MGWLQYGFNANGWRTWRRRNLAQQWDQHFNYDRLGQVVQADRGDLNLNLSAVGAVPQQGERWQYDPTGNWRRYEQYESGIVTLDQPRVHDRGNRLMEVGAGAGSVRVDRAGRMLELPPDGLGDWQESLEVQWDAWSRIVRVSQDEELLAVYAYDGLFRRITRTVDEVVWHCYYSDDWRPLEETKDTESEPSMQYLWGVRHRDDLVRRDRATVTAGNLDEERYVMMDYYSPAALADESGEVTERYVFSAFGIRQILTPGYEPRSDSECLWEFAFQGQFKDAETGWLDYGYRYYIPYLGRWPSKDPIEEEGSLNLYAMVENDTINKYDLFGLQAQINIPQGWWDPAARDINDAIQDEIGHEFTCEDACVAKFLDNGLLGGAVGAGLQGINKTNRSAKIVVALEEKDRAEAIQVIHATWEGN